MDYFNWEINNKDSKFPATLIMKGPDDVARPVLVISKNQDCYSSLPIEELSFIIPFDIFFEDIDNLLKENIEDLEPDVLESKRLDYACKQYKEDFIKQLNKMMNYFRR